MSEPLDPLTFEADSRQKISGYRFRGRWVTLQPWRLPDGSIFSIADVEEIERAERDAEDAALPAAGVGDKFFWGAYPPDQLEYEAFVGFVLRRASISDPGDTRVVPFTNGLADGLDVRAMVRFWHEDRPYVREARRGQLNVTNGVIDWTSDTEESDVLQRRHDGGWCDPTRRGWEASRESSATRY
ncbi:MAG: hypothetical protein H0V80_10025 [Acidobacteria bacterium]|nr:hypothetical protein [Acidobacteriota bacterium]